MNNINRVVITGNLTADPELRLAAERHVGLQPAGRVQHPPQGRRRRWVDKPNYFNVTVWGAQGENVARYLSKGRPVAVDGRLEWREWEDRRRRQAPGRGDHRRLGAVPAPRRARAPPASPELVGAGAAAEEDTPF